MSFEQNPPPNGPPPAPLPGGPAEATVYRQDEFVRQPTAWTRPMQMAVAVYLVVSALISLASQFLFKDQVRALAATQMARQFKASGRTFTDADVRQAVDLGVAFALVFGAVFVVIYVVLALLSATRPRTWVFWVDLVLMALGVLGLISSVGSLANPSGATLPPGAAVLSLIVGLVNLALVTWMIAGLVKFGPWAQEKVPATL